MVVVALAGHLTGATLLQVASHLAPLVQRQPPILVVDLSRVRACDAIGVLILDVAARVAADYDGEVRLAAPASPVSRALRQAGTMQVARTFGTVGGAVHADPTDLLATPAGSATEAPAVPPSSRTITVDGSATGRRTRDGV